MAPLSKLSGGGLAVQGRLGRAKPHPDQAATHLGLRVRHLDGQPGRPWRSIALDIACEKLPDGFSGSSRLGRS